MKTVIDGIYPFTACFDMNMTKFEYEALPYREDLEFGPVVGNFYRARGEPELVLRYKAKNHWQFYHVNGIKDPE